MLKKMPFLILTLSGLVGFAYAGPKKIVALDCFHNNEKSPHYLWSQTDLGGYSKFAQIVLGLGADTISIHTAMDSTVLAPLDVLIISDPDTPSEATNPQYVSDAEAAALQKWVQRGGKLMLLGNNVGNCEFTHFNVLAGKFGIHFNEDTQSGGSNFGPLPTTNPLFTGCTTLYVVDMCSLTITSPAQAAFTFSGDVLVATAAIGTSGGKVFALGDPWVYNEHLDAKDNIPCVTNVMKWFLGAGTGAIQNRNAFNERAVPVGRQKGVATYTPSGRLLSRQKETGSGRSHGMVYIVGSNGAGKGYIAVK